MPECRPPVVNFRSCDRQPHAPPRRRDRPDRPDRAVSPTFRRAPAVAVAAAAAMESAIRLIRPRRPAFSLGANVADGTDDTIPDVDAAAEDSADAGRVDAPSELSVIVSPDRAVATAAASAPSTRSGMGAGGSTSRTRLGMTTVTAAPVQATGIALAVPMMTFGLGPRLPVAVSTIGVRSPVWMDGFRVVMSVITVGRSRAVGGGGGGVGTSSTIVSCDDPELGPDPSTSDGWAVLVRFLGASSTPSSSGCDCFSPEVTSTELRQTSSV